ncbi:hypothetical protein HanRHA438_Chr11g0516271 [Helianthus annuus]|nr:hypothetical protein HanRHA438_Chr11g0516271 [Helianthus annuus]
MAIVWNFTSEDTGDRIVVIGSGNLKMHFDTEEEKLTHYINNRSMLKNPMNTHTATMPGTIAQISLKASGAYIFRLNGKFPIKPAGQRP